MNVCDFSNSYVAWTVPHNPNDHRQPGHVPWGNSARIQLDARCEWVNERTGEKDEFFLITPCRTEWMYRSDTLFQTPNREYCAVWSRTEFMGVGGGATDAGEAKTVHTIQNTFTEFRVALKTFPQTRVLENDEQIIQATLKDLPLVGRTEIWDEARQRRAMIEYPIKTMNIHPERKRFQVDTGPLLFPDLISAAERAMECFSVAFVCYNTFDAAEFILRQPTPIRDGDKEICSVIHYSDVRRVPAKNVVVCAGEI